MRKESCAAGIGLVLCLALAMTAGAQTNTQAWKEAGPELRVYDIKAFFARTPIYNFATVPGTDIEAMRVSLHDELSQGGQALYSFQKSDPNYERDASGRAEQLKELLERMVKPKEAWESAGGRSAIEFVVSQGVMLVSTTEDGHKQIEALLKQILPGDRRNVAIDIEVVELDKSALGETPPVGFVAREDKEKAALKKAVKKVLTTTSLSGTDGQVLSNEKGCAETYVSEVSPIVAEQTVAGDATVATLKDGLAVQVQAALNSAGTKATFDFRLANTRTLAKREAKTSAATSEQTIENVIELPKTVMDLQAGTLTLPLGCRAVVAGGSVPTSLVSGNAEDAGTSEVYYIVSVRSFGGDEKR